MSFFLRGWLDIAYPKTCFGCDMRLSETEPFFCSACQISLQDDPHTTCPRCASTIGPYTDTSNGCVRCRNDRFAFEGAFRLGPYEGDLRDAILKMKQARYEGLAYALGQLLAQREQNRIHAWGIELVLPIPIYWIRRVQTGYNQSEALAEGLAHFLALPLSINGLRKIRWTKKQTDLSASERRTNLRKAFAVTSACQVLGKKILLMDDVLTTGSTAHEVAKVLKQAGADAVYVAVLAHR